MISVGGWQYATSSPASLRRLAEVYLALFRQIGPELLIDLRRYLFVYTFYIPISLSFILSRPDPRPGRNSLLFITSYKLKVIDKRNDLYVYLHCEPQINTLIKL